MPILVYDWEGNERDLEYLFARYGRFRMLEAVPGPGPRYAIHSLHERADGDFDPYDLVARRYTAEGQAWEEEQRIGNTTDGSATDGAAPLAAASLTVRVVDEAGRPVPGTRVAFYWQGAPLDLEAGPAGGLLPGMASNRCVTGVTEAGGETGFPLGPGAYFWPGAGQVGPHAVWVHGRNTRSDVIADQGMVAMTNHYGIDVWFVRLDGEPEQEGDVRFVDENGQEMAPEDVGRLYSGQDVFRTAGTPCFRLVELRAASGESKTLTVAVQDENGAPLPGVGVALGPRDVAGAVRRLETDGAGQAVFGLDDSHRYYVPSEQGHWSVGITPQASDVYNSAGWVFTGRKSPGRWFNPTFRLAGEPEVPDPDPPEPPEEGPAIDPQLRAYLLARCETAAREIAEMRAILLG